MKKKSGFTLIELLVVVLIIGILSAVALPQYKKSVSKERTARVLPLLRSLAEAEERFYLANGYYTEDPEALDISFDMALPGSVNQRWHFTAGGVSANYNYLVDIPEIGYYYLYPPEGVQNYQQAGKYWCNGWDSDIKKWNCNQLGQPVYSWTPYFTSW